MATLPGSLLMVATTPYASRGIVYETWKRHFGEDNDPIFVWHCGTRRMNPSVPQSIIDDAMERDPSAAAAEYLAQWRSDLETFVSREVIDDLVVPHRHELPPVAGITYLGFCDPSGGAGTDSMTLAIAHRAKDGTAVLDCVRERRPPFSPDSVTADYSALLKAYGLRKVTGDKFAGAWPSERFATYGITYEASERTKSQIYQDVLATLNSGRAELLDHPRLVSQLTALERRTARGGRDSIDHAPGGHDDVANSVCGALLLAAGGAQRAFVISQGVLARSAMPGRTALQRRSGVYF
jgi:hypothetical protein